jgi:RHS repeat-associated protein
MRLVNAPDRHESFIQTIWVAGRAAVYLAGTGDTDSTIASALSTQINALSLSGVSAEPSGADILLTAPIGTALTATGLGGVSLSNSIFNNTFLSYNSRGQLLSTTDPTGIVMSLTYDSSTEKMLTSTMDFGTGRLNLETSFGYDSVGNVTSITDPRSNTTNFEFDAERRLIQKTDPTPFNFITNWQYNANGWLTSLEKQITGSSYQIWGWVYLANGMVQTVTDPLGYQLGFTYDELARLTKRTDAEGRQYQFAYDALSRISTITDPMNVVADSRAYTANGMLASRKDANSNVTLYQYDGFDRLSQTGYPDTSTEQYTYDANNNVLTMKTRIGDTITNTFDVLNRLITKQPGSLPLQSLAYDLVGRQLSISTPVDGSNPASGSYGYSYDTAGRLVQQTMPNGDTVGYQLDQNGNRTQLIYPDGYYAEYAYDQLNRLTTISLNGSTSASVSFEYDELSRRTQMSYDNGCVTNYAYALNNDLTSLQHLFVGSAVTFQFACNNVHQIVGLSADDITFLWEPSASSTVTYATANDLNQYASVGGIDYSYSGNGCLTGGPQSATFDSLNRVTQIVSGSTTNNYWTDPLNRQARKSVNGTDTNYLYNGQQLIATYNDSGTLLSRFIPGLGLDEHFIDITGSGNVYLHTDRIGSVIAETNASGALLNKFSFSPFGESSSVSSSNFGYTGQRYDSEIGLYNYKMRYYSPSIGRFLQPDPLGYDGGDLNLYAYVGNDALNATDPMGLATLAEALIGAYLTFLAGMSNKIASGGGNGSGGGGAGSGPLTAVPPGPNLWNPLDWFMQPAYAGESHPKLLWSGVATYYGPGFVGKQTNSEPEAIFDPKKITGAIPKNVSKTFPVGKTHHEMLPFYVMVTQVNKAGLPIGKPVRVLVNDTGSFGNMPPPRGLSGKRVIDLSAAAYDAVAGKPATGARGGLLVQITEAP